MVCRAIQRRELPYSVKIHPPENALVNPQIAEQQYFESLDGTGRRDCTEFVAQHLLGCRDLIRIAIPEAAFGTYTSATFRKGKTKQYQNALGVFTCRDIPSAAYPAGVEILLLYQT